ncbi:DUF2796 domain-containing protein [Ruegeria sp. THAF33]|uniref:ZrgA family zinc uptake protein n=1 Tax=Ruegeria sp. THAF33 TaxID=2587853 RepID=UPI001267E810|nr:DUF2796 domain-containing protein [Ruegeria sp. THAF33]QFT73836.1 hypothetical protein FIU92_12430 [Ruegeria sp. THAF33]
MKCSVLALSLFPAALAAQATQITPTHQHGSGQLEIVFADTEFTLSLRVPSIDIIGFETPVASDDDRTRVAIAISELSKPLDLFVVPPDAVCFTASANVILTHDIPGQQDNAGEGGTSFATGEHSEFQADYVVQCQDMDALTTMEFAYFQRFSGTEKLNVRVGSGAATSAHEITRAASSLDMTQFR